MSEHLGGEARQHLGHRMSSVNGGTILREAFRTYARHAWVVLSASIVIQTVGVFVTLFGLNNLGEFGGLVFTAILIITTTSLTTGVCTVLLLHLRSGNGVPQVGDLIAQALPRLLGLIGLGVLTGIGITLGYVMLVVPGLYLTLRWAVTAPAMVAGPLSILDAMGSSHQVTKQAYGTTFVIVLFQGGVLAVGEFLSTALAGPNPQEAYLLADAAVSAILAPIASLALAELYLQLSGYVPDEHGVARAFVPPAPAHQVHVPQAAAPVASPYAPAAHAGHAPYAPVPPSAAASPYAPTHQPAAGTPYVPVPQPGAANPYVPVQRPAASPYVPAPQPAAPAYAPTHQPAAAHPHAPAPQPGAANPYVPAAPLTNPGGPAPVPAPAPAPPARTHSVAPPGMS